MTKANFKSSDVNWDKMENLVPAIVQNDMTGKVLMLGYMNKDALSQTIKTNQVTFFSRSKKKLWTKGESSGNILNLVSIELDCDQDAFLVRALPTGPTCHTGTISCFNNEHSSNNLHFLGTLETIIKSRKNNGADKSYVASLFKKGAAKIAQKVGEEGVEVALAHTQNNRDETIQEASDLLFHLMILLEDAGLSLGDIVSNLEKRHQNSD